MPGLRPAAGRGGYPLLLLNRKPAGRGRNRPKEFHMRISARIEVIIVALVFMGGLAGIAGVMIGLYLGGTF